MNEKTEKHLSTIKTILVILLIIAVLAVSKISGKVTYKGKSYSFASKYTNCSLIEAGFMPPALKLGSKTL
ncbi:MAG: hypothetical protein IKT95_05365, partial [Spirochaetales bacterium]|nr:hypothetical protein [Spirochaetales bacterium]